MMQKVNTTYVIVVARLSEGFTFLGKLGTLATAGSLNLTKLKKSLACKIFDTMIAPFQTYNSQIWGGIPNQILILEIRKDMETLIRGKQQRF